MLRRLHTRIVGIGAVCGLPPSQPAEVFLKTLPPPAEVDPIKYRRFKAEEEAALSSSEPFYDLATAAAGHKHIVFFTKEGNLITCGDNRYGQTGAPKAEGMHDEDEDGNANISNTASASSHQKKSSSSAQEWAPLLVDLAGVFKTADPLRHNRISCGSNFTVAYQTGGRRVIAFGNNHVGQLGAGHKRSLDPAVGFVAWDPTAPWWPEGSVVERITCGYNHSVVELSCGSLFAFGSNTWGELSTGCTDSPMLPTRIPLSFSSRGERLAKVAVGNSFTLFLTKEGRVYGCGASNFGQLPRNTFDPVPIALTRNFLPSHDHSSTGGGAATKLIRVRDIACVGSLAVYLTVKNEILIQGALPEYGVSIASPRLACVDQQPALEHFRKNWSDDQAGGDDGFQVAEMVAGPSTLLVRYRNGCVGALGANSEGQLYQIRKNVKGRTVNLAPCSAALSLLPVMAPTLPARRRDSAVHFTSGHGFTLLLDHDEVYFQNSAAKPIELPPGARVASNRRQLLFGALS